jgi:hypothetical protein
MAYGIAAFLLATEGGEAVPVVPAAPVPGQPRRGRPPVGESAMSPAEAQRRYRQRLLKARDRLAAAEAELARYRERYGPL